MGLLDVLNQYAHADRPPPNVFDDFDQVASEADPDDLTQGLTEAFESDETPPFEQMLGQLYERSDENTRAGVLNEILGSLGGGAAGGLGGAIAGGVLGNVLRRMGDGRPHVSASDARAIPAQDIQLAAAEARRRNPGVVEKVSRFYARNPRLVQVLGQAALGVLMRGMARRRGF